MLEILPLPPTASRAQSGEKASARIPSDRVVPLDGIPGIELGGLEPGQLVTGLKVPDHHVADLVSGRDQAAVG